MTDAVALASAFAGVDGVIVLVPPMFDPALGFPEVGTIIAAPVEAIQQAPPPKLVCLSAVGAHSREPNLLGQLGLVGEAPGALPLPAAFLWAACFMENAAGAVVAALETDTVSSFLQPVDLAVPMVASGDIGRVAAEILRGAWQGRRVVKLEWARPFAPNEIPAALSDLLGCPVRVEAVAGDALEALLRRQGMRRPGPRMLDGFEVACLAASLSVSAMPVCEALITLAEDRLVELRPSRGRGCWPMHPAKCLPCGPAAFQGHPTPTETHRRLSFGTTKLLALQPLAKSVFRLAQPQMRCSMSANTA